MGEFFEKWSNFWYNEFVDKILITITYILSIILAIASAFAYMNSAPVPDLLGLSLTLLLGYWFSLLLLSVVVRYLWILIGAIVVVLIIFSPILAIIFFLSSIKL